MFPKQVKFQVETLKEEMKSVQLDKQQSENVEEYIPQTIVALMFHQDSKTDGKLIVFSGLILLKK